MLLTDIMKKFSKNPIVSQKKMAKTSFIISHSASDVEYTIEGFRDKNKDEVSATVNEVIIGSENK